ncbi:unnamed protein product [Cylicostephanus goldi]|uniref:Uncharacterized protein n=1 Tax=Cylicostephanus goldi TaxID=71465 RepID=A0A3P6RIU1_CYLGO|nr:unnamed protein product [Cylicostephanus goldi]
MSEEAEEADLVMLKAHMRRVFEDTCHEFNLTDEFTSSHSDSTLKAKPSKYVNEYGLKFNTKKFENDLVALFLHNKLNAPFFSAFEKIAHTGQLMKKSNAFVLYEVPEYVLINGDEIFPVNFDSCKAMNGTYFLCMEKIRTYCDITTITSCDLYAMPTDKDFYFTRSYGSGMIVATNLSVRNLTSFTQFHKEN